MPFYRTWFDCKEFTNGIQPPVPYPMDKTVHSDGIKKNKLIARGQLPSGAFDRFDPQKISHSDHSLSLPSHRLSRTIGQSGVIGTMLDEQCKKRIKEAQSSHIASIFVFVDQCYFCV